MNNQKELLPYEKNYIINNVCCNIQVPFRTQKEWGHDNREKINENARKNYDADKAKEYREKCKEQLKITKANWYLKNRERLLQKQKEYDARTK